jgi:hypothetical protein
VRFAAATVALPSSATVLLDRVGRRVFVAKKDDCTEAEYAEYELMAAAGELLIGAAGGNDGDDEQY